MAGIILSASGDSDEPLEFGQYKLKLDSSGKLQLRDSGGVAKPIGGSADIVIPKLQLHLHTKKSGELKSVNEMPSLGNLLRASWQGDNSFLDYNPKIWLFRYKVHKKMIDVYEPYNSQNHDPSQIVLDRHGNEVVYVSQYQRTKSKWVHPPHVEAIEPKHTGYYRKLTDDREHATEFLTAPQIGAKMFEIPVIKEEWFSFRNSKGAMYATGYPGRSIKFRFAIVIEKPNYENVGNPYIIGPMSDPVKLTAERDQDSGADGYNFSLQPDHYPYIK